MSNTRKPTRPWLRLHNPHLPHQVARRQARQAKFTVSGKAKVRLVDAADPNAPTLAEVDAGVELTGVKDVTLR